MLAIKKKKKELVPERAILENPHVEDVEEDAEEEEYEGKMTVPLRV